MTIIPIRPLLLLDAITCAAAGGLLVALSMPLAALLGLPAMLLFEAGLFLIAFAGLAVFAAARIVRSAAAARIVAYGNVVWAALSLLLVTGPWVSPTPIGMALVAGQALVVGGLAALQFAALARAGGPQRA